MSELMRYVAAVLLSLFVCSPAVAVDFPAPQLICVLGTADAVVRIDNGYDPIVDSVVTIEDVIRGEKLRKSDRIQITGEGKWYAETLLASVSNYSASILFLLRETESAAWRLAGPLGAGRMLERDGYVYLGGFATDIPRETYHQGEPALQRLDLNTLLQADHEFRLCVTWRTDEGAAFPQLVCPMNQLLELRDRSELHRLLVDEVIAGLDSGLSCSR